MDTSTFPAPVKTDRQMKLVCQTCGAIARMSRYAVLLAGGYPRCIDGGVFAPTTDRRHYSPRGTVK